jgi:U4/U6.U5 tri-snRNP-associated protein 2
MIEKGIKTEEGMDCPYLGTIKRHLIDFDLDQVCSVSLSNINVYGCLVCGRFFQGKGLSTPAYEHSI